MRCRVEFLKKLNELKNVELEEEVAKDTSEYFSLLERIVNDREKYEEGLNELILFEKEMKDFNRAKAVFRHRILKIALGGFVDKKVFLTS